MTVRPRSQGLLSRPKSELTALPHRQPGSPSGGRPAADRAAELTRGSLRRRRALTPGVRRAQSAAMEREQGRSGSAQALGRLAAALRQRASSAPTEGRRTRAETLRHHVEDYLQPRAADLDAPLLVVIMGSTGSGKSSLLNALVGRASARPASSKAPTTRRRSSTPRGLGIARTGRAPRDRPAPAVAPCGVSSSSSARAVEAANRSRAAWRRSRRLRRPPLARRPRLAASRPTCAARRRVDRLPRWRRRMRISPTTRALDEGGPRPAMSGDLGARIRRRRGT